jgi:uncharacterized integral membrane protein (TIGR02327 family)
MSSGGLGSLAWDGLFSIFVTLGCIVLAWLLMQEVRWDRILRQPHSTKAKLLQLVVSVVLGHLLAKFILDYWYWTGALKWMFIS